MLNFHQEIVDTLKKLDVPYHYEMKLKSGLKTPCISYMELTNFVETQTDVADISLVQYQLKVWGNSIAEIQPIVVELDKAMRDINFKRVSSAELFDTNSTMIQKVLTYEALASEEYNK